MGKNNKVLVLGATGGLGYSLTEALLAKGWQVIAMTRNITRAKKTLGNVEWVEGDALNLHDVKNAANGCSVIVHGVNPPGYKKWSVLALPMLENTLAAAEQNNATVVFPGNVYNFAQNPNLDIKESTPQQPKTRKGDIRVMMEARLQKYSEQVGRVIIVRAGDFFGPHCKSSWFAQGLVKAGKPINQISNLSVNGVGHQWAYLPDVAQTIVALLERAEQLEPFACFHMAGHWDEGGALFAKTIQDIVHKHTGNKPKINAFPWWIVPPLSLINETIREVKEMRYLWQVPVRLNNQKLLNTLGEEPHTPLEDALTKTLIGLGCLD